MAVKKRGTTTLAKIERNPGAAPRLRRIVFDAQDHRRMFEEEFQDVLLTGPLVECRVGQPCNVVRSVLDAVQADGLEFERCDFKDTSIRNSTFSRSALGHSSWLYNSVVNTTFESCSFSDWSLQNSDFAHVRFVACDFSNVIIKTCRFDRCEFISCVTNNKVFETSQLTRCNFRDTQLQIQTIAENFGITQSQYSSSLRSGRADRNHQQLRPADIRPWLLKNQVHPLSGVSIEYFLSETLLDGSTVLDKASELASWLPIFRTAGSFSVTLNQWIEFLLWLFEQNQVTVHTLLAFHSMTDQLIRELETRDPDLKALGNLSGTHLALARAIDKYLDSVDLCAASFPSKVTLLVEGKATPSHYYKALALVFERSAGKITKLVRHNSPWDMTITFGPASSTLLFMAFFLATRTSFELARIHGTVTERALTLRKEKRARKAVSAQGGSTTLLAAAIGLANPPVGSPGLRLRAYLPGNLLAELRLNVSSRQIAKVRRVLKDLL